MSLDLLAFNAVVETADRLDCAHKAEILVAQRLMQHDLKQTKKDMKGGKEFEKLIKNWTDRASGGDGSPKGSAQDFKALLGKVQGKR